MRLDTVEFDDITKEFYIEFQEHRYKVIPYGRDSRVFDACDVRPNEYYGRKKK